MEPSQRSNSLIQAFPSVPVSHKAASKADVSRAQLALNKIASNFLAKYEKEPIDDAVFMELACTWSRLDSELCSCKPLDDDRSINTPNANLTAEKIQQIANEISIFGKEVKALAHPESVKKVKDLEKPRIPDSSEVKASEPPEKPTSKPLAKSKPASTIIPARHFDSVENGPIGLTNIGNSCYLNSSLQMLFNISDVRNLINQEGPKAKKGSLLSTLFELLNLKNVEESAVLTKKLRTILLSKGLDATNGVSGQKDAHEVLNIILDELKFSPMQIGCRYQSNDDPNLSRLTDTQATYELAIELADRAKAVPLQDVINGYFRDEIMPMDSHITMDNQEVFDLKKSPEIVNLPSHLVISLNRFKTIGEGRNRNTQKIMTPIQIPADKTVLLPYGNKKVQYEVIGYVNHHGKTMRSGHYTANVKNCLDPEGNQRWIQCNDSNVKVSAPTNQSSDPYIFLLKRKSYKND